MKIQSNIPILAMNYPVAFVRLLERQGVSSEECLRNTGLSQEHLMMPDKLVTSDQTLELVRNGIALSGSYDLGLQYGSFLNVNAHGILGMALLSCKNLDSVFNLLNKFLFLQFPFAEYRYSSEKCSSVFEIDLMPIGNNERRFFIDMAFSCIYSTVKMLTGLDKPDVKFEYSGSKPLDHDSYKNYLGGNVRFGKERVAVILPSEIRDRRLKFYEPVTLRVALSQCESLMIKALSKRKMELRVNDMIANMATPFPDIEAVADRLNMCSRTVRRKLKLEGVTYQEILDEKRKKIAIKYLMESDMTITQISTELYFSDSSYFSRAFKRWTGVLPKNYRLSEGGTQRL